MFDISSGGLEGQRLKVEVTVTPKEILIKSSYDDVMALYIKVKGRLKSDIIMIMSLLGLLTLDECLFNFLTL